MLFKQSLPTFIILILIFNIQCHYFVENDIKQENEDDSSTIIEELKNPSLIIRRDAIKKAVEKKLKITAPILKNIILTPGLPREERIQAARAYGIIEGENAIGFAKQLTRTIDLKLAILGLYMINEILNESTNTQASKQFQDIGARLIHLIKSEKSNYEIQSLSIKILGNMYYTKAFNQIYSMLGNNYDLLPIVAVACVNLSDENNLRRVESKLISFLKRNLTRILF